MNDAFPATTNPRWLDMAAAPGRNALRVAAAFQAMETILAIVVWGSLAWIAQRAFTSGARPAWPVLSVLLTSGLLAAAALMAAARFQAEGRRRISTAVRGDLVDRLLPSGRRRAEPDAPTAALAIVELSDDVADYHAQTIPQRLSAPVSMVVVFATTAVVQWPAAVILALSTLAIPLNMRLAGLFAKEGSDERVAASARLGAVVLDSFRGMRTLESIGALTRRRDELAEATAELNATTMTIVRRAFLSGSVMDVVITFSIAVNATYVGLSLLGYVHTVGAPPMTLWRGLLVLLLCPTYFQPVRAMAAAHHVRERAASAVPTIATLLGEGEPEPVTPPPPPPRPPITVVLRKVSYTYPRSDQAVLHEVDVTIRPNSWTAIVGASGTGKTSLLSLIAGLREPTAGTARWVTPAGAEPPQLGQCAWIGQQTVLLPGSIGDNICIGRRDASRAEVDRAVAAAGLSDVIDALPQGLETPLGEGGVGISTGEARRIAIARAFLRGADLWVLDEPTAHLDAVAETRVVDALHNATEGRTVVVATHSVAVARSADSLLRVSDGTVHPVLDVNAP